ncbi:MAG: CoA transferase [bacterium]|nr:CoA transferase [bacterium]
MPTTPAGRHAETLRSTLAAHDLDVPGPTDPKPLGSASAAADWAASGAMALSGPRDGPPRLAPGAVASAALGAGALLEAMSAALAAGRLDWRGLLGERAAGFGHTRHGRTTAGGAGRLLRTADDWLAIQLPRLDDWRLVPAWLEIDLPDALHESDQGWRVIEDVLRERAAAPVIERARLIGLAGAPAPRAPLATPSFFSLSGTTEGSPRERPLRVLDLSTLWAGPLATSLLSFAGASVLKVESPKRPDGARLGPAVFFDRMNAGKHGAALDLHDASDRTTFEALLNEADLVVESARPRALRQLGFDAETWVAEVPGRIWLSITGYGRAHEWIAFGDDAAIAAGLGWAPGAAEDDPCFCGDALADPLTGVHAAVLALACASNGRGGLLEVSLRDVAAHSAATPIEAAEIEVGRVGADHVIREAGVETPVAPPRIREANGTAPPLAPPSPASLDAWRRGAC